MVDQVRGLREARIDACDCVNSGMDAKEKAKKLNMLQNGAVLFMLLSPERFMMENFRSSLLTMTEATQLGVTPSTVSANLKRLARDGLISYEPYGSIELTEDGRAIAVDIVRRHRILETYLVHTWA